MNRCPVIDRQNPSFMEWIENVLETSSNSRKNIRIVGVMKFKSMSRVKSAYKYVHALAYTMKSAYIHTVHPYPPFDPVQLSSRVLFMVHVGTVNVVY